MSEEFHEGDLVEAVKGEESHKGRIRNVETRSFSDQYIGDIGPGVSIYLAQGYTLNTIEKAAPKLPTEPGLYEDTEGDVWMQDINRDWFCLTSGHRPNVSMPVIESTAAAYAPFTRLEPVPVTAKKVLDRLSNFWEFGPPVWMRAEIKNIATEFGISE